MSDFYRDLDKAELHVHLEGSLEPETLRELDPALTSEEIAQRYQYTDFAGFIAAYKWIFGYLRTPDAFALAAKHLLGRLASENVRYAEINLSVGVYVMLGLDVAGIYDAVVREAARAPIETWWVFDAVRQFGPEEAMIVAELAAERANDKVVAFGVGGDETAGAIESFEPVFRFAASHGLKLVPHAGETLGPESVRAAVNLGADRIGHGFRAAEDPDLLRLLRERHIPLEICLSSNAATAAVARLEDHPVRLIYDAGVPVVLNTDDPAMFRTTLSREYELAARVFGFTPAEIDRLARNSFRYAFRSPLFTRGNT